MGCLKLPYNQEDKSEDFKLEVAYSKSSNDYFPYGKILRKFTNGSCDERYLTTGHERDHETLSENNDGTGLDNRGARFYDSDVARFLSLDPAAMEYPSLSDYNYVAVNPVMFIDPDGKRLDNYTIHADGGISRELTDDATDSYTYVDRSGTSHDLGTFSKNSNGLIQLPSSFSYANGGLNFGFNVKSGQESKSYINPTAFASLFGALASTNTSDLTINQFSNSDGSSPSPSRSHINGKNGDLRYLRNDNSGGPCNIYQMDKMSRGRQTIFNAALNKFGWTDLISSSHTPTITMGRKFGRTEGMQAPFTRDIDDNHYNHLHLQGYRPHVNEWTRMTPMPSRGLIDL